MRLPRSLFVAVAGLLLADIATAQTAAWAAPSSGYVYDPASLSIRPVAGFVGSAMAGPSIADGITWVSVAPNQQSALATQNGSDVWIPNLGSAGSTQPLKTIPRPRQAIWSADSSQAVVLAQNNQLIWLTSFNSGPVVLSSWNLEPYSRVASSSNRARSIERQGVWSLLAADTSANQVLLSLHVGETWQLWVASSAIPPSNIPFTGNPVAAVFAQGVAGAFIADAAGHRIVQINELQANPVLATIVSSPDYVNDPSAMALSSDGKRLFLADHTDSVVRIFAVGSGNLADNASLVPVASIPTYIAPVSLTAFSTDRFQMNSASELQPFYFLDTGISFKLTFVPGVE